MDVQILVVSKLCSEILYENKVTFANLWDAVPDDLHASIHQIYPSLKANVDYKLYWRYNETELYSIVDYVSLITFLIIPYDKIIYLMLNDYIEPWFDNIHYLKKLDRIEAKEKRERDRDIYDVRIKRPGQRKDRDDETIEDSLEDIEPPVKRTDAEIVQFALRHREPATYYTCEQQIRNKYVNVISRGWPQVKQKLIPVDEDVTLKTDDKKGKKDKGKKDAKGKQSKKDKKGDKKNKKK